MNIALWIVQGLMAAAFLMAGVTKAFQYEKAKVMIPWVKDVSKGLVTFIGWAELLGGLGLILPWALGVATILTLIAASGIGLILILSIIFHVKRNEYEAIAINPFMLLLLVFIVVGRF